MNSFLRSLGGGVQRLLGGVPAGSARGVPRWTLAELGVMSLAGVLLLAGLLLIATGGGRPAGRGAQAPQANVTATKVGAPNPVAPGQQLVWTITFSTDADITVFSIDDVLPAGLTYVSSNPNNLGGMNCGLNGSIVECRNGSLLANQSGSVTITTMVDPGATGTIQNSSSYVWSGGSQQQVAGSVNVVGASPTATDTAVPTDTPIPTDTPTGVATDTPTPGAPTDTPIPTDTATPGGPTDTPTETATPGVPTDTATPGGPTDTPTETPTGGGGPTDTPTITPRTPPTALPTLTPTFTDTPGPSPTPTQAGPTDTPTETPTETPVGGGGNTPTNTPTKTPTTGSPPPPPPPGGGNTATPGTGCGDITGTLTSGSGAAANVSVELRSKANSGADTLLATGQTDSGGVYHFRGVAASPADARYYIRYPGGAGGTVAVWYGPGFTYAACDTKTLDPINIADVAFTGVCLSGNLTLPGALTWTKRNDSDLYHLYVYSGTTSVLDSGELGNVDNYTVAAGALPNGSYTAIMSIRSPNNGYGQAQATCIFSIGTTTTPIPPPAPPPGFNTPGPGPSINTTTVPVPVPVTNTATIPGPAMRVIMLVDQTAVNPGETLNYTIVILNGGNAAATTVNVSDTLVDGLLLDPNNVITSRGTLRLSTNRVEGYFGTVAPGDRITVTIKSSVVAAAGTVLTNSALLSYDQSATPLQSNTVQTTVVGFGTPKPVTGRGTPVPVTGGGQTNSTGGTTTGGTTTGGTSGTAAPTTTPTTGGEFPLATGLALAFAAVLLRRYRLRRQAAAVTTDQS